MIRAFVIIQKVAKLISQLCFREDYNTKKYSLTNSRNNFRPLYFERPAFSPSNCNTTKSWKVTEVHHFSVFQSEPNFLSNLYTIFIYTIFNKQFLLIIIAENLIL